MKKTITFGLFFLLSMVRLSAQSNTVTVGGEAIGSGGTASFTAGEVFYTFKTSASGSSTDGVQQGLNNSYAITFDANLGTGTMATQILESGTAANLTANAFTRTGYTFAGWATTSGGAVAYANSVSYTMGSADVTLFAKWTANNYTITFDVNGGTGTMSNQSIAYLAAANLTANAFTRTGYTFSGWATTSGGTVAYANSVSYTMGSADVTLYGQWTLNPFSGSMQIFIRQSESMPRYAGGIGTSITLDVDSSDSIENIKQKIMAKTSSVPIGNLVLVFRGAIIEEGRTLADYNIQHESTVHLLAVRLYPATSVVVGGAASVLSVAAPGADYTDKTVSTTPDFTGSVSILPSGEISIQNAAPAGTYVIQINTTNFSSPFQSFTLTVYNNYTVTFDANGGLGSMATQTIASGTAANFRTNAFTRTGYTFAGWATTSAGTVTYANSASYTMGSANITLFAKWNLNGTTTQLRPMHCGKTLRWLDEKIQATPVSGATQYRFEVIRTDNALDSRIATSNSYLFNPSTQLSGGLIYGKSYKIRVALFTGSWLAYGPECIVTAPSEPICCAVTKLRPFQCGATLLYMTQVVEATPVYLATTYEFEVTSGAGIFVASSPYHTFSLYYSVPGRALTGTAYSIRVRSKGAATAFTAWGDPCNVTTPIARMSDTIESGSIFNVKAFPNPFASHFSVDIESSSDAPVEMKVYDMLGRTLEVQKATISEISTKEIGNNYPSGVYNVVVSQGDKVKSLRLIKR